MSKQKLRFEKSDRKVGTASNWIEMSGNLSFE
jgi:hypothetical protein